MPSKTGPDKRGQRFPQVSVRGLLLISLTVCRVNGWAVWPGNGRGQGDSMMWDFMSTDWGHKTGTVSDILIAFKIVLYDRWVGLGVLKPLKKPNLHAMLGKSWREQNISKYILELNKWNRRFLRLAVRKYNNSNFGVCPLQSHQMPTLAILPTVDAGLGCLSNLKYFFLPAKKRERDD